MKNAFTLLDLSVSYSIYPFQNHIVVMPFPDVSYQSFYKPIMS